MNQKMTVTEAAQELLALHSAWGCDIEIPSTIIADARQVLRKVTDLPTVGAAERIQAALDSARHRVFQMNYSHAQKARKVQEKAPAKCGLTFTQDEILVLLDLVHGERSALDWNEKCYTDRDQSEKVRPVLETLRRKLLDTL